MSTFVRLKSALLLAVALPIAAPLAAQESGLHAFTGATLLDGRGGPAIENAVLLVEDGRVREAGPAASVEVPASARVTELAGRFVMPGLINSHGHSGDDPEATLALYARYGVTTVLSLGGEDETHLALREEQDDSGLRRARVYIAGPVPDPDTAAQAEREVAQAAAMGVDWIKIRVNSGSMPQAAYAAAIETAHAHGLPLAAHMVTLEDAKGLLRQGVDLLAHSVRDREIDAEFIDLMRESDICLTPTLTREVSTFVYESTPDFFGDPFFLRGADPQTVERLQDPVAQRRVAARAQQGKDMLAMAQRNLKRLHDEGLPIAMGTDSGFAERFVGYFEHMEMTLMAEAGLPPEAVLHAATAGAAACIGLEEELGTLEPGKWADFLVLTEDPREDILNTRTIESVWIAGNRVPGSAETVAERGE